MNLSVSKHFGCQSFGISPTGKTAGMGLSKFPLFMALDPFSYKIVQTSFQKPKTVITAYPNHISNLSATIAAPPHHSSLLTPTQPPSSHSQPQLHPHESDLKQPTTHFLPSSPCTEDRKPLKTRQSRIDQVTVSPDFAVILTHTPEPR